MDNKNININGNTAAFAKRIKKTIRYYKRASMKIERENDAPFFSYAARDSEKLISRARRALFAIRAYKNLPCDDDGKIAALGISESIIDFSDDIKEENIIKCLSEMGKLYDSATLSVLPEFIFLALFERIANAVITREENSRLGAFLRNTERLRFIDFFRIFLMFSVTDKIFSNEKAKVYPDCDRSTKFSYISFVEDSARKRGESEESTARDILKRADDEGVHVGALILQKDSGVAKIYTFCLILITFLISLIYFFLCDLTPFALLILPGVALSVYMTVKELLVLCFKSAGNDFLPRLYGEKVKNERAVIAVMTILCGKEHDTEIFDRIENFYLVDENKNRFYAVVCNLPDADRKSMPSDDEIVSFAKARISALNLKYGEHFGIFIRERRYSRSERKYIGWERKRGAVLEFCRFARGKKTSITKFIGNKDFLSSAKYLITLDSDTNLYSGSADELIGTMLHPLCTPKIKDGRVVSGHAVIQPHISSELESAAYSEFSSITAGNGGIDSYAAASFDIYENIFGAGSFCGKGILDIDVFLSVCDGFFPNERILSHDLLEGNLLGSAIASDITLTDATPKNALSYYTRAHRWIRGDLQTIPYLFKNVKNQSGDMVKNPMDALSKYKIIDNILSSVCPLTVIVSLLLSALVIPQYTFLSFLFLFSYLIFPIAQSFLSSLVFGKLSLAGRRFHSRVMPHFLGTLAYSFYKICALPYEAYLFADAAVRTAYRFLVSKRNFLAWKTAASADSEKNGVISYISKMWFSSVFGIFCIFLPSHTMKFLGILWFLFPASAYILSLKKQEGRKLGEHSKEKIRKYALDMWGFFRDLVNEKSNFLPPDNYEVSPAERIAYRTSPTNIGLYLASVLGARDMSLITSEELFYRAKNTAVTLAKMLKWHGHLYNWYDIKTLSVIGEPFVSTVDSGNFVCAVSSFCEGIKEYIFECPKLIDVLNFYEGLIRDTEFSALYDRSSRLFYIGYDVKNERYSDSYYDTFMSEARMTSFFSVARGDVPREHFFAAARPIIKSRGYTGIASWSGTVFEYFMPALFIPIVSDSLSDEALSFAFGIEKSSSARKEIYGKRRSVFGVSESGYFAFDSEMNYQYKAFGRSVLALDPECRDAKTFSAYSSFLMMRKGVYDCLQNLSSMEKLGAYGEYGFYEAIDFDSERVGDGYAIIKSFMSHHIGMSFIACVNMLFDDIFVRRFMKNPKMRASRELLCEKIAVGARAISNSSKRSRAKSERRVYFLPEGAGKLSHTPSEYSILFPSVAMISNNKTRVLLSSSGHIKAYNGNKTVFYSEFSRFSLMSGLRFYAVADGDVLPLCPLQKRNSEFDSKFFFEYDDSKAVYTSFHKNENEEIIAKLIITVMPDSETFCAEISVNGGICSFYAFAYAEPVLEEENAFLSHKSFSNLFMESKYYEDEETLVFKRRPRSGAGDSTFLGVRAFPDFPGGNFDTDRGTFLPLMYGEEEISSLSLREGENSDGAMIVPMLSMRTGENGKRGKCGFYFSSSSNEDEILFLLSGTERKKRKNFSDITRLQYGAAGISKEVSFVENHLLSSFCFDLSRSGAAFYHKVTRDFFWKHGISGNNNSVFVRIVSGNDAEFSNLAILVGVFKYMCIRGERFDLILLYPENDFYRITNKNKVYELLYSLGVNSFIGRDNGIFVISEENVLKEEIPFFELLCDVYIDLSIPLYESCGKNRNFFSLSEKGENSLLKKAQTRVSKFEFSIPENPVAKNESGYFTDGGFFVEKPHGNIPYSYIIASEKFGSVVSENSLGFSYYENSALGKLTPHSSDNKKEDRGERIILRVYDEFESGDYFDFDLAACSESVDFSYGGAEYKGKASGIGFTLFVDVDKELPIKIMSLKFHFDEEKKRRVKVFFIAEPCLAEKPDKKSAYTYMREKNAVFASSVFENRTSLGILCRGKDTGTYADFSAYLSDGHIFSGVDDVLCVYSYADKENSEVLFFLGAVNEELTRDEFTAFCSSYTESKRALSPFFGKIDIETGNAVFDLSVNYLFPYQTMYSRIFARSGFYQVGGAYGFRDQLQDTLSFIDTFPSVCKEQIVRCASHQYKEGDVAHWWHEYEGKQSGLRTRYSDDLLWLPFAVYEYVKKTGDVGILDIKAPYLSSCVLDIHEKERYETLNYSGEGTVYEHIISAAELSVSRGRGEHGLMKFLGGDWNDGMNFVGIKGNGESVWLTEFASVVFSGLSYICGLKDDTEKSEYFKNLSKELIESVSKTFCDEWYLRGYYDDGSPLGKKGNAECEIDSISQSFAAFAEKEVFGMISENTKKALFSAYNKLYDKENRIFKLLSPAFDSGEEYPGYIKGYVPGIRENGGQYTHAAVWAAMALLLCGKKEEGKEVLMAINPAVGSLDDGFLKRYLIEPYAMAGDVYSNPSFMGRGGWSFYTGAAAWYRIAVIETFFGYTSAEKGFYLRPNLTDDFDGAILKVNVKGTFYTVRFTFSNTPGIVLDDRIVENSAKEMGNFLFPFDGKEHYADFCMKKEDN